MLRTDVEVGYEEGWDGWIQSWVWGQAEATRVIFFWLLAFGMVEVGWLKVLGSDQYPVKKKTHYSAHLPTVSSSLSLGTPPGFSCHPVTHIYLPLLNIFFLNDFKEGEAGCTDTGNAWCNLLHSEKGLSLIQAIFRLVKQTYLKLEDIQRKYGIQYTSASPGLCLLVAQLPTCAWHAPSSFLILDTSQF